MIATKIFRESYTAEDGLCGFSSKDFRPGKPGCPQTCRNDNGILIRAFCIALMNRIREIEEVDKENSTIAMYFTAIEPGLHNRHRHDTHAGDSADNYVGMILLSLIHGLSFHRDIINYGQAHGFNYNNKEPGQWALESQRQGGEIAFYQLCCLQTPEPWNALWFIGGLLSLLILRYNNAGSVQLAWARVEALKIAQPLHPITQIAQFIHWLTLKRKFKSMDAVFKKYFGDPLHPIHAFSEAAFRVS